MRRRAAGDLIRLGAAILEVRDPAGLTRPPDQTFFVDESTVESIIQRRIEPSSFEWLAPQEGKVPELALLKRAQRHLATLHQRQRGAVDRPRPRSACRT